MKATENQQTKRGRGAKDLKEPVFGISEREDGILYIKLVADVTKVTLQEVIKNNINIEARIYSDTWKSYNGLEKDFKNPRVLTGNKE